MKSILILFFLGVSMSVFSQGDFDQRLLAKYSEKQIIELQQKNPDIVRYMEYYLDHGFSILTNSDLNGNTISGTLKLKSLKTSKINSLNLGVPLPLNEDTYYNIDGQDEVLVLHSRKKVMNAFQSDQKNQQLNK